MIQLNLDRIKKFPVSHQDSKPEPQFTRQTSQPPHHNPTKETRSSMVDQAWATARQAVAKQSDAGPATQETQDRVPAPDKNPLTMPSPD